MPRDCIHYRGGVDDVSGDWRIWDSVHTNNEYRIGEFKHEDVVIDIGAHIGSFSALAFERGSRNIYAYEVDPDSYAYMMQNLEEHESFHVFNEAVMRNDSERTSAFYDGNWHPFGTEGPSVPAVTLDFILGCFESVRYLKLDCECSEWGLLYTSKLLERVQEIGGEYHLFADDHPARLESLPWPTTSEALEAFLQEQGFETEVEHGKLIGNFWGWRKELHGPQPRPV